MDFVWFSDESDIIPLTIINQLIFVMVKWGVFFAVRTEILNFI
jgi:hypothetical protein